LSGYGFTGRRQPFPSKVSFHVPEILSSEPALGFTSLLREEEPHAQHTAIQRRIVILLGLLDMLVTVSDLILFSVFPLLVTLRFGLSQQLPRGDRLSRHDGRRGDRIDGKWEIGNGTLVEEVEETRS
jgi:hypothetical protein